MVERQINVTDLKKTFEAHFLESDEVHAIEPLLMQVLNSELNIIKINDLDGSTITLTLNEVLEEMKDCKAFQIFKEDIELKNTFFSAADNLESWHCYANEPDRQVYTKREPGQPLVSLFFRFKVPINLFYPVALVSQADHIKDWMPSVVKSDILKTNSDMRKVIQIEREFPWPFSNREFVLCASGVLVKERKGVMIVIRSINEERAA
jgi:hypothetical protein